MTLRAIAFVPTTNAKGKKDADEFRREAKRWLALHNVAPDFLREFDNTDSKKRRRDEVHHHLIVNGYTKPLEHVLFFCHGLKDAIQTGHASRRWGIATTRTVFDLVTIMRSVCERHVRVTLYACDAARDNDKQRSDDTKPGPGGDGGFADVLRDMMCAGGFSGGWVDAHAVSAHTTRAPYVRRFYTNGSADGAIGADWIVSPGSDLWRPWVRELKGAMRLRFPRLEVDEIRAAIRAVA